MDEDGKKFGNEEFLSRWSRLKQQARDEPPAEPQPASPADPKAPPPELPPVDGLTIDSDFRGFLHPKVDENLRRTALKKLFSNPKFNVMDGLDIYIDDYSKPNPLPAAMLAQLRQAQKILEWATETQEETEAKRAEASTDSVPAPESRADQAASPAIAADPPRHDAVEELVQVGHRLQHRPLLMPRRPPKECHHDIVYSRCWTHPLQPIGKNG